MDRASKQGNTDSDKCDHPQVSVVMSVYNGDRFLEEAVESILAQSYGSLELIVVDDGSTDVSGMILDSCQGKDSRLRVVHQTNMGLVDSLNRGCAMARGRYIARAGADDVALSDRLSWQVAFLEEHPKLGCSGARSK